MISLGDVIEFSYGKALKEADRSGGHIPVVGSGGVVGGHSRGLTTGPTIVVGRKGSIGSVTWTDGPAWPIDTAYFVKLKREELELRWIYWMLKSLRMEGMNKSAAVPGLNREDVYRLMINVPSLSEQRRMAAILDHADTIRAKRRQCLPLFYSLTHSVFHQLFMSDEWVATIGDLARVQIGPFGSLLHQEDYIAGGIPILNPMHIQDGRLHPDRNFSVSAGKAASLTAYRLQEGDVVLGRRGEMGRAGVAENEHAGMLCGTGSLILRPVAGVDSLFLHALMTSPRMKAHLVRSSLGATLPNLNSAIVKSAPAPRANNSSQRRFAELVQVTEGTTAAIRRAAIADSKLFHSIQSRAFLGEL